MDFSLLCVCVDVSWDVKFMKILTHKLHSGRDFSTVFACVFSSLYFVKNMIHKYGSEMVFLQYVFAICCFKFEYWEKFDQHMSQLKDFSPVYVRICFCKLEHFENFDPQVSQVNGFMPVCVMCSCMTFQEWLTWKFCSTNLTFKWFFSSVCLQMTP